MPDPTPHPADRPADRSFGELVDAACHPGDPGAGPPAAEIALLRSVVADLGAALREGAADEPSAAAMRATLAGFRAEQARRRERRTAEPAWIELARSVVAVLTSGRGDPSLVGWRSNAGEETEVIHRSFLGPLGRLDVQAVAVDESRRWRVRGQILGDDADATSVLIRSGDGQEHDAAVDDGAFVALLPPGEQEVLIELDHGRAGFSARFALPSPGEPERCP